MTSRRRFLAAAPLAAAAIARSARQAHAQQTAPVQGGAAVEPEPEVAGASMDGDGYIPVRRPPKSGAGPSMTPDARDAVERQISCPCPCTLDIFTCRTSMPCGFSPRLHQDVIRLVEGGYGAQEIIDAFQASYGERILMAPTKRGFNLVGWAMPFAVVLAGGTVLTLLLRNWRRRAEVRAEAVSRAAARGYQAPAVDDATADERARLEAAVRGDDA